MPKACFLAKHPGEKSMNYDSDDDLDYDHSYEESSSGEELSEPTIECPYCGSEIYEEAERCPSCESYISTFDAPRPRPSWWIVLGVVICLGLVYIWTVGLWPWF